MTQDPRFVPLPYVDRKPSLTFFGILTILGGIVCWLFAWMVFKAGRTNPLAAQSTLTAVLVYGGLGVALAWLGVGSILARRWARALLLILSSFALALGLFVMAVMLALWPKIYQSIAQAHGATASPLPESAKWGILVGICVGVGLILVLPSAIGVFFYSRQSVKATCETRDSRERWTDRAPLPVIAAVVMFAFGAVSMVTTAISLHGVIAFFGGFLTGVPGVLVYALMFLVWAYAAAGMYRLDVRAWWIGLLAACILPVSAAITFQRHGILEFYQLAGYTEAQLAHLRQNPVFNSEWFLWMTLASAVPWIVYLLCIKRYLRRA